MLIHSLIKNLVGKSFEIECSDIEVHGQIDHCPPLFKGPGTISGDKRGPIFFRLHNQIELTKEALSSLKFADSKDISSVRIFAKDYSGCSWTGGWAIPSIEYIYNPQTIIHGQFVQLDTQVKKQGNDPIKNATEIIFGERIKLPYTQMAERKRYSAGKEILTEIWSDRHELCFNGSKICFHESADSDRTHIIAEHKGGLSPPHCEGWLAEALQFICGCQMYPRLVIRHFDKDALIFLRDNPFESKTGMPPPLIGRPYWNGHWDMYTAYLAYCTKQQNFELTELTRILSEVIIASTGTLQAFVLSMAVCVENLAQQLFDELKVTPVKQEVYDSLKQHFKQWGGDDSIKNRVNGMFSSMLKYPSVVECLKKLKKEGVIEKRHIEAWRGIRNELAHGGIINYQEILPLLQKKNTLISMIYRLVYRIIGFKGQIIDHDDEAIELKDFYWPKKSE